MATFNWSFTTFLNKICIFNLILCKYYQSFNFKNKMKKNYLIIVILLLSYKNYGQCTPAKDLEMQKYGEKTKNQDAQGCSQCAVLALYFCSARYSVKPVDIEKVGQLINACKQNIINMGQPYCCPEYINKQPEWGKDAGGVTVGYTGNTNGNYTPNDNNNADDGSARLINALSSVNLGKEGNAYIQNYAKGQQLANAINGSSSTTTSQDGTAQLMNALSNVNLGTAGNNYVQNYAQAQQVSELATGLIDLFTPSPEEQARKEAARIEAAKRAEEYRQTQLKLILENEENAKADFSKYLKNYPPTTIDNKSRLVIDVLDNYISDKYGVNCESSIPEWNIWIKEAIEKNDKYTTVVFAGKTLGFNFKRFSYNIELSKEEATKLLEKVSESSPEYKPHLGISYKTSKKTISEKNKKKKVVKKDINTFRVNYINKGSSAEASDIQIDDIILKINNNYTDDFAVAIAKFKIDEKIALTVSRNDKEIIKQITIGSKLKDNYNVDAMLLLANNYNLKNGGNNPEKALYYFTKAAENGSPNAMYAMAEIYQNNVFGDKKVNVKFKNKKNPEFALEWYLKSIQNTGYEGSNIYKLYKTGSSFEPLAYDELILMYTKGIGCKKNPEKAAEILALKNDYINLNK